MTCDQTQSIYLLSQILAWQSILMTINSGMTIDYRQSKSSKRARSAVAEEGLWRDVPCITRTPASV